VLVKIPLKGLFAQAFRRGGFLIGDATPGASRVTVDLAEPGRKLPGTCSHPPSFGERVSDLLQLRERFRGDRLYAGDPVLQTQREQELQHAHRRGGERRLRACAVGRRADAVAGGRSTFGVLGPPHSRPVTRKEPHACSTSSYPASSTARPTAAVSRAMSLETMTRPVPRSTSTLWTSGDPTHLLGHRCRTVLTGHAFDHEDRLHTHLKLLTMMFWTRLISSRFGPAAGSL
jgi:hypothetical protein